MTNKEYRENAKKFYEFWKDHGYEKGESQPFWLSLLRDVLGVSQPEQFMDFEIPVTFDGSTNFIDGYIKSTHVLIEQKSRGKDLRKGYKQSDGSMLTPFQQAHRYSSVLPYSLRPRWIVTSNFEEILIYDMQKPNAEPESVLLKNLHKDFYRLQFLVDTGDENIKREMEVSIKAGRLVGLLYDEILKQYRNPDDPKTLQSLNMLCVRLVFCLYAEDAGVFDGHGKFYNYINSYSAKDMRKALISLFKILDTKVEDRDPYEDEALLSFPYVNGGLFKEEDIEIPQFNETIKDILLNKASADFDWSDISPTIFGAVFESTLNPETRRSGGMHYTSIENIHKVIDPLFLDELSEELEKIKEIKVTKTREKKLEEYREKLGTLTFLDPACGSGNFLTETYISLRRLENEAIKAIEGDQMLLDMGDTIKVTIDQFYGIEINDFAVTVAKTALWIAESQMMKETEDIIHKDLDFLPLKSNAYIVEANALDIDWCEVLSNKKASYIISNPPYVGFYLQTKEQKVKVKQITGQASLDYVSCWFFKAAEYMSHYPIKAAFVSTNSVTQGEQVALLWSPIIEKFGTHIDFAYRTFTWNSEAKFVAAVHCVIIGFSNHNENSERIIYDNARVIVANNITPYLQDGDTILVKSRRIPLSDVPELVLGNRPLDGQNLLLTTDEYDEFVKHEPAALKWIRPFLGATEFINNKKRYCLWLDRISPNELKSLPMVLDRVQACREVRLKAKDSQMKKLADTPTLFRENKTASNDYVVLPRVSSSRRKYMPIGYIQKEVISGDALQMITKGTIYHFGVLVSNVHNSWLRAVCGRMKSDYRYGKETVYNTFPWPEPTEQQKAEIEKTAQAILDARELYPESSLADLYDELTMPPELRKAHQANDKAVMRAYGFKNDMSESEIVAELMKMYKELTK